MGRLTKPWSYSSLTSYETCPRRYDLVRNKRVVKEPPTEATIWGNKVHDDDGGGGDGREVMRAEA